MNNSNNNFSSEPKVGEEMHAFMTELYPICRSITGNGTRLTLQMIKEKIPLEIKEVPSGTAAFDWTVPKEWNIQDAFIKNSKGEKIVDFKKSNLCVLNYSTPLHQKMGLGELKKNLFTLPDHPSWAPYLTSYYKENWGFCLSHQQLLQLPEDEYEVLIDSSLEDGSLTYGELVLLGESKEEILISTYVCHPSLCNDNLSGVVLTAFLAKKLLNQKRRYTYRFLFIPETIGAIVWLSRNQDQVQRIKHGLVATCVGDPGSLTYKKSRAGNALIDQAVEKVLRDSGKSYQILDFWPSGSDERQFCSPGFNLPVGSLMRTVYGKFPQYHTSADDLSFVRPEALADTYQTYLEVFSVLENNQTYLNQNPFCEPQLGKRGLYRSIGGKKQKEVSQLSLQWVLNLSDGEHSLLDIALRSGLPFKMVQAAAESLLECGLLKVKW